MKSKAKRVLQVATVAFALTMLTAYLVYSQHHDARPVASSSKLRILSNQTWTGTNTANSNNTIVLKTGAQYFPGSKSAPMFDVRETAITNKTATSRDSTNR